MSAMVHGVWQVMRAWGEAPGGRGGGVLSQEKGTNCGQTATELWLSQANIAKKEGLSSHYDGP